MKKVATKSLVFFGYFLGVFFLRKTTHFSLSWLFLRLSLEDLIFWLGGVVAGAHFLKFDQLFYIYFTRPEEVLSLEAKVLVNQKKLAELWDLLTERSGEQRLVLQSFLFQAICWPVLALFVLTSTAGLFGKGLVMAIGLHLLLEEWEDILAGRSLNWVFWQVKREVSFREQKRYLWLMTGLFGLLSLFLV